MMSSIIVVAGPSEGDYFPLDMQTVVVGRDAKCPIQILDEKMSRVHLQIRHDPGAGSYFVQDLKSVNGVIVNDRPISAEIPLVDGDIIAAGDSKLIFFARQFADRKSAWDAYKMAGERTRATIMQAPETPKGGKGFFGRG
jgi:pSer/pThr/pTyr-binding forkhead associated (FHA) protein